MAFLPYTKEKMEERGWESPDFVLVTGDAYVDHPSFGAAIIGRVLESNGYRVAVLSQPDFKDSKSFTIYGNPRLGFLVTGGNIDSMVAHYTVAKRRRHDDSYTPGNKGGKRPDRAVTVYCRKIRDTYPDTPIIIGGIEASLRRLAHYDYWQDKVLPSVLLDSGADILVYGMGERQIIEIAGLLKAGRPVFTIHEVRGSVYRQSTDKPYTANSVLLPSFSQLRRDKASYAEAAKLQLENADHIKAKALVQICGEETVIQNPPALPLTCDELDAVYALPYEYAYPPEYQAQGGVKALDEVKFSLTHNRGCFGGCNFCSIAIHQGRYVVGRSHTSVLAEAERMTKMPDFKGYINDVGGATANFRYPACEKQEKYGLCSDKRCLYPKVCPRIKADHSDYLALLRKLRQVKGVKKVFIRSGIRYDYLLADKDQAFLNDLVKYHVSGQLRVAPEHSSPKVLAYMGKPGIEAYDKFSQAFYKATKRAEKEQYILPYLMSSHPGSTLNDAVDVAVWLRKNKIRPEQVQDFYPTPGTISTAMYYSGIDPFSGKKVYVPRSSQEKKLQRALLQTYKKENKGLIAEALTKAGRSDIIPWLIGEVGKIKPRNNKNKTPAKKSRGTKKRSHH
ncbi:MAG: YgiQ family radical SAM protein [Bacillota bacterium]|nr:YgiQ family radical SAM protein [Bacillota bacterium]